MVRSTNHEALFSFLHSTGLPHPSPKYLSQHLSHMQFDTVVCFVIAACGLFYAFFFFVFQLIK